MTRKTSFFDRYFLLVSVERALFNAYIFIFLATALVTLLGILNLPFLQIDKEILNLLVKSLIVEVIGGVTALFGSRLLKRSSSLKIRLNFDSPSDLSEPSNIKANYTIIDPDTGRESEMEGNVYKDEIGLCMNISPSSMMRSISVVVDINGKIYHGSDWLGARTIDLKQQQEV